MSGLISNVGLFSGLPVSDIINQLMAIEARPLQRIQSRLAGIQADRAAYSDLSARLLRLQGAANRFDQVGFFRSARATSSKPEVLTATAQEGAASGAYAFRVHALVASHQLISTGYADADRTPVGRGALTVEVGAGHVAPTPFLDDLGAGKPIGRGTIEIQDQSGGLARLDLSDAVSLDQVFAAINTEPLINVHARLSGDRILITDQSGGSGELVIRDVGGGTFARDLGVLGRISSEQGHALRGADIHDLGPDVQLRQLNDGNGVRRNIVGPDLRFTAGAGTLFEVELNERMDATTHLSLLNGGNGVDLGVLGIHTADGSSVEIDLGADHVFDGSPAPRSVQTIGDLLEVVNAASLGGAYSLTLDVNTNRLVLTDLTAGAGTLEVSDVSGSSAADLGLLEAPQEGAIHGAEVFSLQTIGDVLNAINHAAGNYDAASGTRLIEAELADNGIRLISTVGDFAVEAGNTGAGVSGAAEDLGLLGASAGGVLETRRLLAAPGSVLLHSLNGGRGVALGVLEITARDGTSLVVDLAATGAAERLPQSLSDVIERIDEAAASLGVAVRARVNAAGNGLAIEDLTTGTGSLVVADTEGARAFGLVGTARGSVTTIQGTNLQLQYLSETSELDKLDHGNGVGTGVFEIRASSGAIVRVDVTPNQRTLGDLMDIINIHGSEAGISAELNGQGDGVLIRDASGSDGSLQVADVEGRVARSLRLLGPAQSRIATVEDPQDPGVFVEVHEQVVDGSFETRIEIDADDTLADLAEKINRAGTGVAATVINDGSNNAPLRLSLTSGVGGSAGRLAFDTGTTGLQVRTLVEARDAVMSIGGSSAINPILIRSSSNTVTDLIDNVTIDLVSASSEVVELVVSPDVDALVEAMDAFVSGYNAVVSRIEELTFFDTETFETGILRGDPAITQLENRLRSLVQPFVDTGDPQIRRFADIGIKFSTGGTREVDGQTVAAGQDGTLIFDPDRFREAFADNPEAVRQLFTMSETVDQLQVNPDGTTEVLLDPQTGAPRQEFRGLGLGFQIKEILDLLTRGGDGVLARRDDALEGQERLFSQRAESINALLDAKRARLERQFANLEESIAALLGQQSSLSAFQSQFAAGSGAAAGPN